MTSRLFRFTGARSSRVNYSDTHRKCTQATAARAAIHDRARNDSAEDMLRALRRGRLRIAQFRSRNSRIARFTSEGACWNVPWPVPGTIADDSGARRRIRMSLTPGSAALLVARTRLESPSETAVRPTSYRVSPALLRPLLFAGAALLLLLALVLAAPVLRRLVPERRDERTPLERALDFVRDSLRRDGADRRRALDLLGRALENDPRSQEAFDLAWSRSDPDPAQAERLTERLAPNR